MKYSLLIIFVLMSISGSSALACDKKDDSIYTNNNAMTNGKIKITINSKTFTATLLDNNSAKAFKEMLPLTINMTELNGDEKYYDLPKSLPTNASNPGTTKQGDLMLFGSKALVLFYKTRSTSYSYTKLGMVDGVSGLAKALGSGNVLVTFEWE